MKKFSLIRPSFLLISILVITSCGSKIETQSVENQIDPTPPSEKVGVLLGAVPTPLPEKQVKATVKRRTPPTVSIMSPTSGIITVWALEEGNWLWGYSPYDSKNFGDSRNWRVIDNPNGSVTFRNKRTDTCMAAHGNGIIHRYCDPNNLDQQFDLVPLTNGAMLIKSASQSRCLRTDLFRKTTYMSLVFANCITEGQTTLDQQWFIAPPISQAYPR
ncbi:hypothetical protein CEP48_06765 [Mergibacter septicus]|uniref:Cytolethal distending toxin subunit A n=1 Tax=Mergibacter septicus TaxID=221402 RepID=A0A8E3MDS2_9PAST|nr:RICIN domain-containing protein [Mergibacter septicus]AWX15898.1 hypothetical protein CEP47_06765 [Mergibacter septicus]QDJ13374.1 hypothetical protein CEP45_05685 [Mergibacter septicus]QDJ15151.1 hypothetical protein CEP48_06765 [Mergibacter septicus]UTU47426.1 hypothetical protein HLL31_00815 [Mergibacter septicus]WMR95393.1 RICIN domain-containing protein [Mergibacter septicus]